MLAGILGHPSTTRETLALALRAYEHVRLPFANHVLRGSFSSGRMYEFWHEIADHDELGAAITKQWDWVKGTSPEEQVKTALQWMLDNDEGTGTSDHVFTL